MTRVALIALEPPGEAPGFWSSYAVRRVWAELEREPIPGVETRLFDIGAGQVPAATEELLAYGPDLVGGSAYVWSFPQLLEIARRLRAVRPDTKVILGGPSARPEMFRLDRYRSSAELVDALVVGDGERVFRRITELFASSFGKLASLPGVAVRTEQGFTEPIALPYEDLATLASPYPLGLVPHSEVNMLETFRGCPHGCLFCQWGGFAQRTRAFSAEVIARDLRCIAELRPSGVQLIDAALNLDAAAFRNLVAASREERLLERAPLSFEVYPSHLRAEHVRFLERIRLGTIGIGVQSYDAQVWRMLGRRQDHAQIDATIKTLASLGGELWAELIMGLPGDSPQTFRRTLERMLELPCNVRVFHCLVLPGALMSRAPPGAALEFDAESLRVTSCVGWPEVEIERMTALLDASATSRSRTAFPTWTFRRGSALGAPVQRAPRAHELARRADSDDLTPWVATLGEPVQLAVARLLGLDANVKVSFRPRRPRPERGLGMLVVTLQRDDGIAVELELRAADATDLAGRLPGRRPWFERDSLCMSYRRGRDGSDPLSDPARATLLRALRSALERVPAAELEAALAALVVELERVEQHEELDDRMLRQISAGSIGANATLRLGFRCNQDCGMCWQSRSWPEPPASFYRLWLEEVAAAGVRRVVFSGGEPTLHPALPELLTRATELGLSSQLQTNAILLRKPGTLSALRAAGLAEVFVSYHSHLPEISDAITRAPGTHGGTEAGILACLHAGLRVELNTVVERLNVAHLGEHARAIVARFVQPFAKNPVAAVTFSYPTGYYDRELWRASLVPLDEVSPHLIEAARVLAAHGVAVDASGSACGFPACVLRDEPRLIRRWNWATLDLKDRSARAHAAVCETCLLRDECPGPRKDYCEVHGERGLVPFRERPGSRA